MSLPPSKKTMKALILNAPLKTAAVDPATPIPTPQRPGDLLIRVEAIALNPVDALYTFNPLGASGRTVGSDFAGTVVGVYSPPPSPSPSPLSSPSPPSPPANDNDGTATIAPGDRVAGFLQGACSANPRPGAFASFVVCPADLVWKIPPGGMACEAAAAVSLCGLTAAQAVFYRLGLPAPFSYSRPAERELGGGGATPGKGTVTVTGDGDDSGGSGEGGGGVLRFFVYGASTSVGMYAAQLVRRSCEASGRRLCGAASRARGRARRARVDGGEGELPTEPIYGAVWEGLGEEIQYQGFVVPASEAAKRFATDFYGWLSGGGELRPNPIRLMPGGLDRVVPDGFMLLGSGAMEARQRDRTEEWMKPISAEKLVYRISG
ncbi:hypothetical protein NEMBOFW57_010409 [Staphylotrichum longicolle]|uniref:Enoyl reductase (ER) domain-containing protein n=1 Tax=Staphylotrichum longicolle TaxID=669026 RepID=A0AAD4EN07_9PEZI|nr:hypothetical protein NEMBOFW57_010409 [Staphylotrichum longicolle]